MRDGFIFYRSFYDCMRPLDDHLKAQFFEAICNYALNGMLPDEDNVVVNALFQLAKPQIDANNKRYENGKKGGRPKTESEPNDNQNETKNNLTETKNNLTETKIKKSKPKDKDKVKDKDKAKDNDKEYIYTSIIALYNSICKELPKCTLLTSDRKKKIDARLKVFTFDELKACFVLINQSDFTSGRSTPWKASFDWIFANDKNILKVLEGNYDNTQSQKAMTREERLKQAYIDIQREVGECTISQ